MNINLGCGYRMRRLDARNWTLDHLHAPDPSHHFTKDLTPRWHRIEKYFQSLDQGLRWCYENELLNGSGDDEVSLKEALDRAEALKAALTCNITVDEDGDFEIVEGDESEDEPENNDSEEEGGDR